MQYVDIAIFGSEIAGLALACGLQGSGLRVVIFENKSLEKIVQYAPSTLCVSTINNASEKLLVRLGIWSETITYYAGCCHNIEIWNKDSFGHISLYDESIGYNHLSYIVENAVIHEALRSKMQRYCDIIPIISTQVQQIAWGENDVFIILQNGEMLTARLLIGADGTNSWLRTEADIPLTWYDYCHHSLVANIRTTEPHNNTAQQIFHNDGILALLPLKDPHLCFINWSMSLEKTQKMHSLENKKFNQALCIAFDNRMGLCELESERYVFPLTWYYARQFIKNRLVLLGNAARTIHPLIGQCINLDLIDVAELIKELRYLHNEGKDIGQHLYLRRYARGCKYRAIITLAVMHCFYEFFSEINQTKKSIFNIAIKLANTIPGIKQQLLRQLIGLNNYLY